MATSLPLNTTTIPFQNATQRAVNMTTHLLNSTLSAMTDVTTAQMNRSSKNMSSPHTPPTFTIAADPTKCKSFEYNFHENIPVSAVCGLCFIIGVILVFVGYRAFRLSMFIMGLSLASVLTYLVLINKTKLGLTWTSPIAAGAGLFLGLVAASVPLFGLVIASIIQGLFFTVIVLFIVTLFLTENIIWICIGSLGGLSIVFAIIAIVKQRSSAVVYITSYGAMLIMLSADYFLDLFLIANYAYDLILQGSGQKPCWFSWTLFAMWPFLLILGCCVQFLKTARGYYHSPAQEKKAQESKYKTDSTGRSRRLYDNGDVIAQVRSEECLLKDRETDGENNLVKMAMMHHRKMSGGKAWIQTTDDTLDKRRSFTPVYEYESGDDKESTTLV